MNLDEFFKPITDAIVAVPNFAEIGIFIVFALSIIPFMPVPTEPIALVLILAEDPENQENFAWTLAVLISVGAFISHVIVYMASKHHLNKLVGKSNPLTKNHWFHRHIIYLMFFVPSVSIFLPPLIDGTMVILGHYQAKRNLLFALIFAGEMLRAFITGTMLINLI